MTEYPAVTAPGAVRVELVLHRHQHYAFGFALVVMLAHIGSLAWSDFLSHGVQSDLQALLQTSIQVGIQRSLQIGLHVAIAVMLTALSSILPNRGFAYLGVAFALLVIGESAATLATASEFGRAYLPWLYAGASLGYVALVMGYALREDARPDAPATFVDRRVSVMASMLMIGVSLTALLSFVGIDASAGNGLPLAMSAVVGVAPIAALVVVVKRRGGCMISIWLVVLLAVQALVWSGRHSPGSWGAHVALFSNLAAELALLNAIMMSIVQHARTQTQTTRHLQTLASTDSLTGLYNRRYLDDEIERACQRARREGTSLSVLMADIDHFKLFNDTYGHLAGDECLRRVGAAFSRRQQRGDDVACRYGGEEFAMILPACDLDAARGLATQLCKDVRALGIDHACSVQGRVSLSIGVATIQVVGDEWGQDLLRLADDALYAAKRAGRDTVRDMTQIYPLDLSAIAR